MSVDSYVALWSKRVENVVIEAANFMFLAQLVANVLTRRVFQNADSFVDVTKAVPCCSRFCTLLRGNKVTQLTFRRYNAVAFFWVVNFVMEADKVTFALRLNLSQRLSVYFFQSLVQNFLSFL